MIKVFLGGTCNNSNWRNDLIPLLNCDYFNPVVDDWTPECQAEEIVQRANCDYVLYVITPAMIGVYSIAEVVDDSNKRPDKTIFVVLTDDGIFQFGKSELKSLNSVKVMIKANGGTVLESLSEVADYLNGKL
jgi:hypothetical protein